MKPQLKLFSNPSISTSTTLDIRLGADWIASAEPEIQTEFLDSLSHSDLAGLPWLFDFWAMEHQIPPSGDWRTWVIMGGRGAGKTRAGAEWVRTQVEGSLPSDPGLCKHVALVGETIDQARDVMVFGESGILACSPPDRKPKWVASRNQLEWANGAVAKVYSAFDPESLRGPQFDCAWVDELAKWKRPEAAWDMLQFALRLGDMPRQLVTTTPRNRAILKDILADSATVTTHASTEVNRANLADDFLRAVRTRYEGSRLGRQELDGVLIEQADGALWSHATFEQRAMQSARDYDRVVVAVDPPVSHKDASDECGIVVVGAKTSGPPNTWRAVVLADLSYKPKSPNDWAGRALSAVHDFEADRLVAEVNQGGAMVETIVRSLDPLVPYRAVHASRGKIARAEPVAALYEQGRVSHVPGLKALEDQMCQMTTTGFEGKGSPDRVDALVWALHDLMLGPAAKAVAPKIRAL